MLFRPPQRPWTRIAGNSSAAAAPIIGVANRNETLSASSRARPIMSAPASIDPVRANPREQGEHLHRANSCRLPSRYFASHALIGVRNASRALRPYSQQFWNTKQQNVQREERGHV